MQLLSLADKTNLSKIIFEFEHQGVFKECLHLTDDLECHGEGMGGGGGGWRMISQKFLIVLVLTCAFVFLSIKE